MAQHDYTIANQTFPATRTDLNNVFAAIVSQNSGASAPSTTYAYQLWYDTTADILKMRNANDDAWINLFDVDQVADTALAAGATVAAGSNLIINGAMQVAQRGTSATTESYGSVDRFFFSQAQLDNYAWTQTQQSVTDLAGFTNSFRITTTTAESAIAAAELAYVGQKIEAQNLQQLGFGTSSAKKLTLSFYVKSSVTGTFSTNLFQTDDSRIVNAEYTINTANTWERKEITYAADQTGVIDNNNGTGFYVTWNLALGSNWKGNAATAWEAYNTDNWAGAGTYTDAVVTTVNSTWEITGVQLEVGDTATDFEHRSYGDELARCQRYYQSIDYYFDRGSTSLNIFYYTNFSFPVTMRATPSMTASSWGSNTGNATTRYDSTEVNGWIMNTARPTGCLMTGNHANIYNKMQGRGKFDAEL